jgi:hypothetical protein
MGLNDSNTRVTVAYDPVKKRFYIEKPLNIDELHAMNQKILKDNRASALDYKSGDGFRTHVAKKYNQSS